MTRTAVLLLGIFSAHAALAQYQGPAVDACLAFAKAELKREGSRVKDVVIVKDSSLDIQRYTRKLGNQFVSSILTGNGAVVLEGTPAAELSFICLLADDKRALFFEWLRHPNAPPIAQCTRDEALRRNPRDCLKTLLTVAETDLTQTYALHFQEARERDDKAGNENAVNTFRKANDEWKQYRELDPSRFDRLDHQEWIETYLRMIDWDMQLDRYRETGLTQTHEDQKRAANYEFSCFVVRHYQAWVQRRNGPELSPDVFQNHVMPLVKAGRKAKKAKKKAKRGQAPADDEEPVDDEDVLGNPFKKQK